MLLPTAYLGPIPYYRLMHRAAEVRIEAWEHYPKQTLRNRCLIATAGGVQALTVPVVRPDNPKAPTRDIRISDHGRWRHLHWQALVSAYGMSPFFEYYADDFAPFYERPYTFLIDYNMALQSLVCELLDISPTVGLTEAYMPPESVTDDLREAFTPRQPSTPTCRRPDPTTKSSGANTASSPTLASSTCSSTWATRACCIYSPCTFALGGREASRRAASPE